MTVKLYYVVASPPARAVLLTLKALNIPHELLSLNFRNGEHLSEEYLKLNPQHTIPTLIDEDGFTIADSHAINIYLVNKYAKDDKLYPKDLKAKAVVDQRLFFDCGVLFRALISVTKPYFFEKSLTGLTRPLANAILDTYNTLEMYLASSSFVAGDHYTIADFSVLTTLNNLQVLLPVEKEKYPKITAYAARANAAIPSLEELNTVATNMMKELMKDFNFQIS